MLQAWRPFRVSALTDPIYAGKMKRLLKSFVPPFVPSHVLFHSTCYDKHSVGAPREISYTMAIVFLGLSRSTRRKVLQHCDLTASLLDVIDSKENLKGGGGGETERSSTELLGAVREHIHFLAYLGSP